MKTQKTLRITLKSRLVVPILMSGACVPVSPLGTVVVGAGEDIQIRSLEALTGIGELGVPRQRAVALADGAGGLSGPNTSRDIG